MLSATDRENIFASQTIQIVHKHPDDAHKRRTDLDVEVVVAESYPILLADKVLNFLPKPTPLTDNSSAQNLGSTVKRNGPKLEKEAKKVKVKEQEQERFKTPSPRKKIKKEDEPPRTPDWLRPIPTFQSVSSSAGTSRTITPGGTLYPPLSQRSPIRSPLTPPRRSNNKPPTMLFSPLKRTRQASMAVQQPRSASASARTTTSTPTPKSSMSMSATEREEGQPPVVKKKNPPKLVEFQPASRSIDGMAPKQTLVLRHKVDTDALRDVFRWCKRSVENGTIESVEGWLVKFRDRTRVMSIRECCIVLGLERMRVECERTISKFEQFGARRITGSDVQWTNRNARGMSVQSSAGSSGGLSGSSTEVGLRQATPVGGEQWPTEMQYGNGNGLRRGGYQWGISNSVRKNSTENVVMEEADKPIKQEPSP